MCRFIVVNVWTEKESSSWFWFFYGGIGPSDLAKYFFSQKLLYLASNNML